MMIVIEYLFDDLLQIIYDEDCEHFMIVPQLEGHIMIDNY